MTRGPRVCAWLAVPAAVLACAASLLFALPALSAPEIPAVYATLPWITNMAGFIVGSTMKVQPLSSWNESGALRTLRRVPQDAAVIALDPEDARRYGLKPDRGNLHMLYKNLPVPEGRRNSLQFDPSMLPFLSQRMLIV
ncbi:MAG: hypothetical protein LBQ19_01710, partial [Synergistaceae bacterium]|nr:hypothetical protein [Synergistaceae bacterium]